MSELLTTSTSNMKKTLLELIEFTESVNFKKVVSELNSLKKPDKKEFVKKILLNKEKMAERGIIIPKNISVERSFFYDRRPTLFCVVKYLDEPGKKVTVTFYDNEIAPG